MQPVLPGPSEHEDLELEERMLLLVMEEAHAASGRRHRPWGGNGCVIRMGKVVLLVDCDMVVPKDCLHDVARDMAECLRVVVLQHLSGTCHFPGAGAR